MTGISVYQMDEEARARQRESARRELAKAELTRRRIRELREQIESIEADSDRSADAHQAKAEPIQQALDEIAKQQIDEIAAGREPDAATETRRKKIQTELAEANADLQEVVTRNKELVKPLEREKLKLERECGNSQALANRICQFGTDQDLDRSWLLEQTSRWANLRLKSAGEKLRTAQALAADAKRLKEVENSRIYERRVRRWALELDEARAATADAKQASDALREKMLSAMD